jgi:small-conductance mechanosensitive channel
LQAKKVLQKVISNFPMVLQAPDSDVLIRDLGDNGVGLTLRFWVNSRENFVTLKSNVTETINLAFKQTDIKIPYPQMSLSGKVER